MTSKIVLLLIIGALILVAGLFFWIRSQDVAIEGSPTSPVLVDIITPANGISIPSGESLSILAQAWSPNAIESMELWEDGEQISIEPVQGQEGAVDYSWDLEPTELGVHTFFVRASDSEGELGQSQTLILNVSAGSFNQISAAGGETLADIGGGLGIPISDLQGVNPGIDPQQPLQDGQPVVLPPSPETGEGQQGGGGSPGPNLVIHWQFKPLEEVDQSYCYESLGDGLWQKVPADPFSFFPGDEWLQTIFPENQALDLQLECWGWQGGVLKYLGEGQTSVDYTQIPDELIIAAAGFQAIGSPEMKPLGGGGFPDVEIPAPFALRMAESVQECASHYGGNFWANSVCDGLINAQVKQYEVLVWEWSPGFCWGSCPWGDSIDGYQVSQSAPSAGAPVFKDIPNSGQKVTAFPLPWGSACYAVRAYADILGGDRVYSAPAVYCGDQPAPQVIVLKPQDWLSTDGVWVQLDCENYGEAPYFIPSGQQLSVGVFVVDNDDCFKQGDSTGAVKFNLSTVGSGFGMQIQQALLHVNQVNIAYSVGSDVAIGAKPSLCATRVGKAKADWTGLSSGHFIDGENYLIHKEYFPSSTSSLGGGFGKDVTSTVLGWIDNPSSNNGFILSTNWGDLYTIGWLDPSWDKGTCYSLVDVELEIRFFTANN